MYVTVDFLREAEQHKLTSSFNEQSRGRDVATILGIGRDLDTAALRKRFRVVIDKHFEVWGKFGITLEISHDFQVICF